MLQDWLKREKLRGRPVNSPDWLPSGKVWPTGEFSLGYVRGKVDSRLDDRPAGFMRPDDVFTPDGQEVDRAKPLDLSDAPNSTNRPRRGLKGITGYGQNMVKSFGALVRQQYPHHRVTFGTLTLPTLDIERRRQIVERWSDFVRESLRWLSRKLMNKGLPPIVCSVTEVQPKRLRSSGEGYLHLHLVWLNIPARSGNWAVDVEDWNAFSHRLLCRLLGAEDVGRVNTDVKPVTGEVTRYLAKYMSKGRQQLAEAMQDWGEGVSPSTWWNMTKPARDWVKSHTVSGPVVGELLDTLLQWGWANDPGALFAFLRQIELEYDGRLVNVGWRGRLHPEVYEDLTGLLKCA